MDHDHSDSRLLKLLHHFLSSVALPGFAWIKTIELLILANTAVASKMGVVAVAFTVAWVYVFDDLEEAAEDVVETVDEQSTETEGD